MCWNYDSKYSDKRARVHIAKVDIPVFKVVTSLPTETGFPKNFRRCRVRSYFKYYWWDHGGKFLLEEKSLPAKLPTYASVIYDGFHSYGMTCEVETYRYIDTLDYLAYDDVAKPDASLISHLGKLPIKCQDSGYDTVGIYIRTGVKGKRKILAYYEPNPTIRREGDSGVSASSKPLIMECVIPKGSRYYVNKRGEYVSDRIVPVKLVKAVRHKNECKTYR